MFDTTTYTHTLLGQLETVTDVTGANTWSHTYDLRGRPTQAVDPDKGTTTSTYDAAGNITTSTGTGRSPLAYTYDELGRKTSVRDDTPAGTTRAEWEYDTLPNGIGKLTAATRYTDGEPYTSRVNAYDAYGRPTSTSLVLPDSQSELCTAVSPNTCTYTTTHTYRANGQPWRIGMPAAADLPAETLILGYTDVAPPQAPSPQLRATPTPSSTTNSTNSPSTNSAGSVAVSLSPPPSTNPHGASPAPTSSPNSNPKPRTTPTPTTTSATSPRSMTPPPAAPPTTSASPSTTYVV
nr:hypothetical protein [Salinispora arenicola]